MVWILRKITSGHMSTTSLSEKFKTAKGPPNRFKLVRSEIEEKVLVLIHIQLALPNSHIQDTEFQQYIEEPAPDRKAQRGELVHAMYQVCSAYKIMI